jgi:hypothetical protein
MQPHHARNMAMGVASGIPEVAPLVPQNDYISNTKPATPLWVESYRLSLLWLEMKISQNKWEYPEIIQKQIIDNFSIETHGELGIPHFENPPNPTCLYHNIVNQLLYIIHIITIIIIQNNPTMFFCCTVVCSTVPAGLHVASKHLRSNALQLGLRYAENLEGLPVFWRK